MTNDADLARPGAAEARSDAHVWNPTPVAIRDAMAAQDRLDELAREQDAVRLQRDRAIWQAASQHGLRPPAIRHALGDRVSDSLVRYVLRIQRQVAEERARK